MCLWDLKDGRQLGSGSPGTRAGGTWTLCCWSLTFCLVAPLPHPPGHLEGRGDILTLLSASSFASLAPREFFFFF